MDLEYINENAVIDRYVLGQLTEQEQVEFELYFLENPEVLDEIDMARALKEGLSIEQQYLRSVPTPETASTTSPIDTVVGWFKLPAVLTVNFAVMAALVVTILLRGEPSAPVGYSAERVWVGEVRGESAPIQIDVRSASLVLDIDVEGAGNYEVSLQNSEGENVAYIPQITSQADALLVVIDTRKLSAGNYILRVIAPSGEAEVSRTLVLRMPK